MKFFKFEDKSINLEQKKLGLVADIPSANGQYVPNGKSYFDRIGAGEIIMDAPVFDYFHLQSFGLEKDWEWKLQDIHGFMGVGSIITGFYISDRFKNLLETYCIAKKYHFYPTKLLFKGEKLDYWIFQIQPSHWDELIDFSESVWIDERDGNRVFLTDYTDFVAKRAIIEEATEYNKDLISQKIILKQKVDFMAFYRINTLGTIVSERLKQAIESAGLEGFLFSEIEYEVSVDKNVS